MPPYVLAYNTSGFSNHRLDDCLRILATLGYGGVSLTPDVHHLDPFNSSPRAVEAIARLLAETGLQLAIETGARYVLDPWRKHWPTLLDAPEDRERRLDYLRRCIALGSRLGARCVSLWSGTPGPDTPPALAWERLLDGLRGLLDVAEAQGVRLCLEPEPGMLIGDMTAWDALCARLDDPRLGLTLDLGHVACTEQGTIPEAIHTYAAQLHNVHIEDIRDRVHQHLPFGEGELRFGPILQALEAVGYRGLLSVELGRDGHRAPTLARQSLQFLRTRLEGAASP